MTFSANGDTIKLYEIPVCRKDYTVGTPVRLLSCNTGNTEETGDCFVQILANELRTTVYAPTDVVIVKPNGESALT